MAITAHDIVPDSPTNNFCTLNPLTWSHSTSTLSEGNLKWTQGSGNYHSHAFGNLGTKTGKFYFEVCTGTASADSCCVGIVQNKVNGTLTNGTNGSRQLNQDLKRPAISVECRGYGFLNRDGLTDLGNPVTFSGGESTNGSAGMLTGVSGTYNGSSNTPGFNTFTSVNIVIGVYLDFTDSSYGEIQVNVNNAGWQVLTSFVNLEEVWFPAISGYDSDVWYINTGQDPTFAGAKSPSTTYTDANGVGSFYHQPPTGAKALCTANLTDFTPDVDDDTPQDYFKAVKYTGQTTADAGTWDSGTSTSTIAVGFQPDFVWVKKRSGSGNHFLADSVSGANKELNSNNTAAQVNNTGGIQSFNSSGFTVGTDGGVNGSSATYVGWNWKAGGAPTADNTVAASSGNPMNANGSAATSSNSSVSLNGTLQSNYTPAGSPTIYPTRMSINTDAGFSIVKYTGNGTTGAKIPHGLNSAPDMIIIKNLGTTFQWETQHIDIDLAGAGIHLNNNTEYNSSASDRWDSQRANSTVVTVSNNGAVNEVNKGFIMYCWHSVEGYSKFGSYTGNGSADGPFVYTGFRPSFVICKCTSDATTTNTSWAMYDNARDSSNVMNKVLYANESINEGYRGDASTTATDIYIDFLSNGFKARSITYKEEINDDGETYIFMAFAEQPFKFSNAR